MKNTVLIVEPRILDNTTVILNHYVKILGDNWEYVFYCGKNTKEIWEATDLNKKFELRELQVENFNCSCEYNDFMKTKALWEALSGDFVLTFQLDTWIINEGKYNIDYFLMLNKSYVGGNQSYPWFELEREGIFFKYKNFNGGLSLRKRKDMIKVIETFPPEETELEGKYSNKIETDAEDVYFTIGCHRLGFPIGNDDESSHFALHTIFKEDFFGIHQPLKEFGVEINRRFPYLKYMNSHLALQ